MKFRKKPVVIEARQLSGDNAPDILFWIGSNQTEPGPHIAHVNKHGEVIIRTLEGDHRADVGDWIIRGVKGEFYPCRDDIFRMTYEPA